MLTFIVSVALFVASAIAVPWTNATCIAEPWSFNTRTQSPCLMAAYLCASCMSDNVCEIYSLRETGGGPYVIPPASANSCVCSSVLWNLLSACALCQRELPGSWTQWVASCPNSMASIGKYSAPIPADITIPSWAYYDFTTAGMLNSVIASQQLGPESSAFSGATNTVAPTNVPAPTTARAPPPTSTAKPVKIQSGSSSSSTGAIIGGVVGCVLGIGLIALIAFVLTRKRKSQDPAANYETNYKPPMTAQFNPTPVIGHASAAPTAPLCQVSPSNQPVSPPEYDPYDPSNTSTFPTGPVTHTNGHYVESIPYSYQPQGAPGQKPYPTAPQV